MSSQSSTSDGDKTISNVISDIDALINIINTPSIPSSHVDTPNKATKVPSPSKDDVKNDNVNQYSSVHYWKDNDLQAQDLPDLSDDLSDPEDNKKEPNKAAVSQTSKKKVKASTTAATTNNTTSERFDNYDYYAHPSNYKVVSSTKQTQMQPNRNVQYYNNQWYRANPPRYPRYGYDQSVHFFGRNPWPIHSYYIYPNADASYINNRRRYNYNRRYGNMYDNNVQYRPIARYPPDNSFGREVEYNISNPSMSYYNNYEYYNQNQYDANYIDNRRSYNYGNYETTYNRVDVPDNVCWEFNTADGCRKGSQCRWDHQYVGKRKNINIQKDKNDNINKKKDVDEDKDKGKDKNKDKGKVKKYNKNYNKNKKNVKFTTKWVEKKKKDDKADKDDKDDKDDKADKDDKVYKGDKKAKPSAFDPYNVCWEFNTFIGCRRGANCKWNHRPL